MLRYFGSYDSYEELTAILAVPTGTVRGRLAVAKLKLADILLASAGLADGRHAQALRRVLALFNEPFRELYGGERDRFVAYYADDLHIAWFIRKEYPHSWAQLP